MTELGRVGVRVVAVAAPIAVAAAAAALREFLANTSAALVLVLVVVAVTAAGDRIAGVLAALSAAAAFDFFLTVPYFALTILDRDDIETAVGLLAIGIAITEMAQWGRRYQALAARREGYLTGVANAARMATDGAAAADLIATVERMITEVLDLDECRFEGPTDRPPGPTVRPVLGSDRIITWGRLTIDVARDGLPTMDLIELPAGRGGTGGQFLLTASSRLRRPDGEQLQVALALAEQVMIAPRRDAAGTSATLVTGNGGEPS